MQRTAEHYESRQNPDDVRFTKRTIYLTFPRQVEYANIYDVLSALESKKLNPRHLPSLRVVFHGGQLWTLDNSLLYIYRISPKVKRVPVVYISGQRFLQKFFHNNSVASIERMASAEFFPDVLNSNDLPVAPPTSPGRPECLRLTAASYKPDSKSRSSTPVSASMKSVSSSRTATSRISSDESMRMDILSPFVRSKLVHGGGKRSISRPASSTNSSKLSTEQSADSMMECSTLRSRTDPECSDDFLESSVQIFKSQKSRSSPPTIATRPSTSGSSSKMSRRSFTGATRVRLGNMLEVLTRSETDSAKSGVSPPKRLEDLSEEQYNRGFATRDEINAEASAELLEAFNLPEFCYLPPKMYDPDVEDELAEELSASQKSNVPGIPSEDNLDRSVSSCSSSTERPMPRLGSRHGIPGSPARAPASPIRTSISAGKPVPCHLSKFNDNDREISKRQLLKYMKQTFFSVY